jgi:hypothetical protein
MLLGDTLLIGEILQFVHQAPAWIQQRACWPTLNCLDCHRLCVASRLRQRLAPGLSQVLWSMDDIVALHDQGEAGGIGGGGFKMRHCLGWLVFVRESSGWNDGGHHDAVG